MKSETFEIVENDTGSDAEANTGKSDDTDTKNEFEDEETVKDIESAFQNTGITSEEIAEALEAAEVAETLKHEEETFLKQESGTRKEDESRMLEGRIICIDPGHQSRGNYDTEPVAPGSGEMKAKVSSGTAGVKTGIPEHKLNLEVALKLRDALERYGAIVIMTRTESNVDISNAERAAIANDANADLYFRIHADGSTDRSVHGVSVLIPGRGHITDEYILEESEKAGSCILSSFVEATGAKRRGMPKRNDLSGFNWCKVPMALIEMGFMSNAEEDAKLNSDDYQEKMVKGMVDGMIEYFTERS